MASIFFITRILFGITIISLVGCARPSYHGIPETTWKQLTSEQKQLIVDEDFDKMMHGENEIKAVANSRGSL